MLAYNVWQRVRMVFEKFSSNIALYFYWVIKARLFVSEFVFFFFSRAIEA